MRLIRALAPVSSMVLASHTDDLSLALGNDSYLKIALVGLETTAPVGNPADAAAEETPATGSSAP
ncbi:MAG: hypothetical protein JWR39_726 [Devosia sp.]|nr:hypothetical protein [Devosia sp.]